MKPQGQKIHADYLRNFWNEFGVRRRTSRKEWHETIATLQIAGNVTIQYKSSKATPQSRRKEFDRVKNIRQRYKFKPGDVCFACGSKPDVRHHIIWLKNGGRNNKRNICFLCNDCHAEVHPWLKTE